jgi:ATP-dependent Clp protease protease subunit
VDQPYNSFYIFEEFTPALARDFVSWLDAWDPFTSRELYITINSPGGSAYSLFSMLDAMRLTRHKIVTIGSGHIMSCGFLLFISGRTRVLHKTCTCLSHRISAGAWGNISDHNREFRQLENLHKIVHQICKNNSKLTVKQVDKILLSETDRYISVEDMLKYGLADELI